jgi:hypothetical protein
MGHECFLELSDARQTNGFRDRGNRSASDLRTFLPVSRLGVAALLRDFVNPFGHDLAVATGPRASDDDGNPKDKFLPCGFRY